MGGLYVTGWRVLVSPVHAYPARRGAFCVWVCSGFPIKELGLFVKYVLRFCARVYRRC